MKKWLVLAFALGLMAAGCGSTETKTVTQTVQAESQSEGSSAEAGASEEALVDEPTPTTIPDGTWAKGEYTPGQYRAPGGPSCWWEKLEKLGEEVFQPGRYGSEERNILVDVDSRFFKTEECGVWQKVG
ncbi:MAG TPA: hypothetical protein VI039_12930 [Solirubrobacterales bacterium]